MGVVVVARIVRASWNLGRKTLKRDYTAWAVAIVACAVTIALKQELVWLFLAAGVLGIVAFAPRAKPAPPAPVAPVAPKMHAVGFPALLGAIAPSSARLAPA